MNYYLTLIENILLMNNMNSLRFSPYILLDKKRILHHPFRLKKPTLDTYENVLHLRKILPVLKKVIIVPVILPLKMLSLEFGVVKYLWIFAFVFLCVGIVVYFVF